MSLRFDLHIHTKYLGCADSTMELPAIVDECKRLGVEKIAITDHLNRPDQVELHLPIRKDILDLETDIEVYFGVELNYDGLDGEFVYNEEIIEKCGFQFAIGGIHYSYLEDAWDAEKAIEIQHRHHLKTCEDSRVTVLVHPYWFSEWEFDKKGFPPFDMRLVPKSFARELGQAAVETGTVVEINAGGNVFGEHSQYAAGYLDAYLDFMAVVAEEGALFSVASDAHSISQLMRVEAAWNFFDRLGLSDDRLWQPAFQPLAGGG